jgi:N,N'-diacetylchitobiose phosphorylase
MVKNPDGVEQGVKSIRLNGVPIDGPIPPQSTGSANDVLVTMGSTHV